MKASQLVIINDSESNLSPNKEPFIIIFEALELRNINLRNYNVKN